MIALLAQQASTKSAEFDGLDGFLGTRGSFMLDVVFLAMFAILPVLGTSIYLAKFRRHYLLHKRMQLALGMLLVVAIAAFEIDMQLITDWEQRAAPSPYFDQQHKWTCPAGISLLVHLCFAVPTAALWIFVIVQALRKFPRPPAPNAYSRRHVFWATAAALGILLTTVTGWVFYTLAFVLS